MDSGRPGQRSHLLADAADQGDGGAPDENRSETGSRISTPADSLHPLVSVLSFLFANPLAKITGFSQKEKRDRQRARRTIWLEKKMSRMLYSTRGNCFPSSELLGKV